MTLMKLEPTVKVVGTV